MKINFYPPSKQANGNFNFGEIVEKKPIGFPQDGGQLKPFSNLFYWAHVQIIRSGNGISHSEEILENSEIFQIWFDPDLSKSLKKPASYNDYKIDEFKFTNSDDHMIRHIHNKKSKMWMDSEDIIIKEYFFDKFSSVNIKIENDKIHSFFLTDGEVSLKKFKFNKGDFFTISNVRNIDVVALKSAKLFEVSSPIKPSYKTYFN